MRRSSARPRGFMMHALRVHYCAHRMMEARYLARVVEAVRPSRDAGARDAAVHAWHECARRGGTCGLLTRGGWCASLRMGEDRVMHARVARGSEEDARSLRVAEGGRRAAFGHGHHAALMVVFVRTRGN